MRRRLMSRERRSIERRWFWPIPGESGIGWWSAGRRRPHTNGGGGLTSLRRGRSQGSAKGGLANLPAPPGAPSPAAAGRKKGKHAPASIKAGPAERWLRALGLHKGVQRFTFSYGAAPHHSS